MGRRFVDQRRRDPYYRAARAEGLRSRAAFKLAYLDDRFHFLPPGGRVLDLGAAPGGFSIVLAERLGPGGEVVAVDVRPIDPWPGVRVVRGRVGDPRLGERIGTGPFDAVVSDLSPRISGAYATDHARSVGAVRDAWRLARGRLARGGAFVAKAFDGDLIAELLAELAPAFRRVTRTKPPASRGASSELYVVALGYRPGPAPPSDI